MIKRTVTKILSTLVTAMQKPLQPPSRVENEYIQELQETFRAMGVFDTDGCTSSEAMWRSNMNRLRELALNHDVREFLRWDIVTKTMFINTASYVSEELAYLKQQHDWKIRWCEAIKESPVGLPKPYAFYPLSSGNLIHHGYHLAIFEEKTKSQVQNLEYVFEFGGGYGSMCRLFFNLGFHGKYVIFDLPAFSALQKYYLKTLGLPVLTEETFPKMQKGILCVSDIQHLSKILKKLQEQVEMDNSLFIATWSLSESPTSIRNSILPMTSDFASFLLAYQDNFGEVNNLDFFNDWEKSNNGINWHHEPIKHLPGNHYLMGKTRNSHGATSETR